LAGITDPQLQRGVHRHLRRLHRVWIDYPIYFLTACTLHRRKLLTSLPVAGLLTDEWLGARERHGWAVGRYVIMPDHVHFFAAPERDARPLPESMQCWKQWTSKRIARECETRGPIWQPEFFDHVLRSSESSSQKWDYVRDNPIRAGLVINADDWPYQGEIEDLLL
jgi:REP element-mobilizing transposase RayT